MLFVSGLTESGMNIEAEINAKVNELAKIVRCNCSICKRKNATMGMVKNEDFSFSFA